VSASWSSHWNTLLSLNKHALNDATFVTRLVSMRWCEVNIFFCDILCTRFNILRRKALGHWSFIQVPCRSLASISIDFQISTSMDLHWIEMNMRLVEPNYSRNTWWLIWSEWYSKKWGKLLCSTVCVHVWNHLKMTYGKWNPIDIVLDGFTNGLQSSPSKWYP
jgi:hypothetical protein